MKSKSKRKAAAQVAKVKPLTLYGAVLAPYNGVEHRTLSTNRFMAVTRVTASYQDSWRNLKAAGFSIRRFRLTCIN